MARIKNIYDYTNAVSVKLKNRKVTVMKKPGNSFVLEFLSTDNVKLEGTTCEYRIVRGKVGMTTIAISEEAMKALIYAALRLAKKNNL